MMYFHFGLFCGVLKNISFFLLSVKTVAAFCCCIRTTTKCIQTDKQPSKQTKKQEKKKKWIFSVGSEDKNKMVDRLESQRNSHLQLLLYSGFNIWGGKLACFSNFKEKYKKSNRKSEERKKVIKTAEIKGRIFKK